MKPSNAKNTQVLQLQKKSLARKRIVIMRTGWTESENRDC